MIVELVLRNFFLVKEAKVTFCPSFNVITGETGSGKSVLLSALQYLLGMKVKLSKDRIVRVGESSASIEGKFDISHNQVARDFFASNGIQIEQNNTVTISCEISSDGRDKIQVNKINLSKSLIKQAGALLIEVSGQYDQMYLLNPRNYLSILDMFIGGNELFTGISALYNKLLDVRRRMKDLELLKDKSESELDYMRHVVEEIDKLNLQDNEESDLLDQKIKIESMDSVLEGIRSIQTNLFESSDFRKRLLQSMRGIESSKAESIRREDPMGTEDSSAVQEKYLNVLNSLETKLSTTIDLMDDIEHLVQDPDIANTGYGENDLDATNERLFEIRDLARKYKVTSPELLSLRDDLSQKLQAIESNHYNLSSLLDEEVVILEEYNQLALKLSDLRRDKAKLLEQKISNQLQSLCLEGAEFRVGIFCNPEPTRTGVDGASFMIKLNKGTEFEVLSKCASGGEMSRILLALKIVFNSVNMFNTLVFDEIDTGIGGKVSDIVGSKIKELSDSVQVVLITHQPQIASKANKHFKTTKSSNDESAITQIQDLGQADRIEEIARMISGDIVEESIQNAKRLLGL